MSHFADLCNLFVAGLTCARTSSQHFTGLIPQLKSVFHEVFVRMSLCCVLL